MIKNTASTSVSKKKNVVNKSAGPTAAEQNIIYQLRYDLKKEREKNAELQRQIAQLNAKIRHGIQEIWDREWKARFETTMQDRRHVSKHVDIRQQAQAPDAGIPEYEEGSPRPGFKPLNRFE
jgi:hypothetical protein